MHEFEDDNNMTDAELNHCIDILRASVTRAFNHYDRGEAKQLGTVFHALLRERAARLDQCGERGRSLVLPIQDYPHPTNQIGG